MSKNGRYSSQRRKVETLTATGKAITVADCGTEFLVIQNGTAAVEHTLPAVADAGQGWWAAFTLKAAVANGDADVNIASADGNVISGVEMGDTGVVIANQEKIIIEGNNASVGTRVEVWTDGSRWYAITLGVADADVTTSAA
jgi:hypothetical protein